MTVLLIGNQVPAAFKMTVVVYLVSIFVFYKNISTYYFQEFCARFGFEKCMIIYEIN